ASTRGPVLALSSRWLPFASQSAHLRSAARTNHFPTAPHFSHRLVDAPSTPAAPPTRTRPDRKAGREPVERSHLPSSNRALPLRAGGGAGAIGREHCDLWLSGLRLALACACAHVSLPTLATSAKCAQHRPDCPLPETANP